MYENRHPDGNMAILVGATREGMSSHWLRRLMRPAGTHREAEAAALDGPRLATSRLRD